MRNAPGVEAFGGGGFRVAGQRMQGSILILDDLTRCWSASELKDLTPEDFAAILAAPREVVEFVLLGTGAKVAPAPRPVRDTLQAAGLGLEVMSTPEACRLYNVLAAEGRRLAAALIAV